MLQRALSALVILSLALSSAGCFGNDARSAFLKKEAGKKSGTESPRGNADSDDLSYDSDVLTPEASMLRDLNALKSRESKQARLIAEMRSSVSENENQIAREEKRLAEIRGRISKYEEALGSMDGAPRQRRRSAEQVEAAFRNDRQADDYDLAFNRPHPVNLALDNQAGQPAAVAGANDSVINSNIPYDDFQAANRQPLAQSVPSAAQPLQRTGREFAGAPIGRAALDFNAHNQQACLAQPESEIVVWNPNDPSQPIPSGVLAAAPTTNAKTLPAAAPQTDFAEEKMTAMHQAPRKTEKGLEVYDENPFGQYATEVFSPDLYLGRGG